MIRITIPSPTTTPRHSGTPRAPTLPTPRLQTGRIAEVPKFRARYGKPVMIDECCYEGNISEAWGSISGMEMTRRFCRTVCGGGYCTHKETFYDENDILWWAKGGVLKGESPARIAFLRSIVEAIPGPLESVTGPFERPTSSSREEPTAAWEATSSPTRAIIGAFLRMPPEERMLYGLVIHGYCARCGDDAFLTFYDTRTPAKDTLSLPENGRYTVEVLDVWEMTCKTILTDVSGRTEISLPGKEDIAVLAVRES